MPLEDIVKLLVEKGVEIAVIVYFMYYTNVTMKEIKTVMFNSLSELKTVIDKQNILLEHVLNLKVERIEKED